MLSLPLVLPMPRIETPVRRAFGVVAVRPGARCVRSAIVNARSRSICAPPITEIGTGTSCARSARLRAVTTISSSALAAQPAAALRPAHWPARRRTGRRPTQSRIPSMPSGALASAPSFAVVSTAQSSSPSSLAREPSQAFLAEGRDDTDAAVTCWSYRGRASVTNRVARLRSGDSASSRAGGSAASASDTPAEDPKSQPH